MKIEKELTSFNDVLKRQLKYFMFKNKINIFSKAKDQKEYKATNFAMFIEKINDLPNNAKENDAMVADIYEVTTMCKFASENNKRNYAEKKDYAIDPIIFDYVCTLILQKFISKCFEKAIGKMTKDFRIIVENEYIPRLIREFGKCTSKDNSQKQHKNSVENGMEK